MYCLLTVHIDEIIAKCKHAKDSIFICIYVNIFKVNKAIKAKTNNIGLMWLSSQKVTFC